MRIGLSLATTVLLALGALAPAAVVGTFVAQPDAPSGAPAGAPNIVVVMVDDLAAGPAERIFERLPTIRSRFLDDGIHFTQAVGETPLCCPGRAGFLSGRHTHEHAVTKNDPIGFDQSRTIATALDDAGYWTMFVGKYFNNSKHLDLPPPGWDHFEKLGGTDQTIQVSERAPAVLAQARRDQPVFMLATPVAPHNRSRRYMPARSLVHDGDPRCRGITSWQPPAFNEADVSDKPQYTRQLPLLPYESGWPLVRHCEQLMSVDDLVRRLEDELARQGRLQDTLWLLMSDNGMTYGEQRWPFKLSPYATPLPLWASWPAGRGTDARDEDQLVSNIDLGPSLASLGGASMPWADGIDWSPLLQDGSFDVDRETALISLPDGHHAPGPRMPLMPAWWGVRSADGWLYIEWATQEKELYDLADDPWRLRNVADLPGFAVKQRSLATALAGYLDGGN